MSILTNDHRLGLEFVQYSTITGKACPSGPSWKPARSENRLAHVIGYACDIGAVGEFPWQLSTRRSDCGDGCVFFVRG